MTARGRRFEQTVPASILGGHLRLTFLLATALLVCNLLMFDRGGDKPPGGENLLDEHTAILAPIVSGGLAIYPIVALEPSTDDDVLVLDEAMERRLLRITEVEPARIDALYFTSSADHPVFLLAGEVIVGGKQDRVIATTTVIPPHTSQVVPVRCVERGRWSGTTGEFTSSGRLAHDRLRGAAMYAEQGDVWHEVARANDAHATHNATDTYRNLAELQPLKARALEERIIFGIAWLPVADRSRLIGYAVAYNGEIAAVDTFRSPALFAKLDSKLRHAYIAEAIELPERAFTPPGPREIRAFIADARRGALERLVATGDSQTHIQRGSIASTSRVGLGDRHLYSNYLGNRRITRTVPSESPDGSRRWKCERHYPSYIGNVRSNAVEDCWEVVPQRRLRRADLE